MCTISARRRLGGSRQGRRMISLALLPFDLRGYYFISLEDLARHSKILRIIPKKQTYKRALQRIYLERTCVHACILLCTRGYTVVYTRVYSSLLGRRYSPGISSLRHRYFYLLSSAYTPSRPCPCTIVISCVSPGDLGEKQRQPYGGAMGQCFER